MATEAPPATILVVDPGTDADALLSFASAEGAHFDVEQVEEPVHAVARVEGAEEPVDVVLLGTGLADPVRVAQRLHSLDRDGAVVILVTPEREAELRHAVDVAPFLEGDVICTPASGAAGVATVLAAAAERTRSRRAQTGMRRARRQTPPPLGARYLGALLDSAPIGIVTMDDAGAVIGWNRRTGEMLGVPEVEALGAPFAQLWPAHERERLQALIGSFEVAGLDSEGDTFERGDQAFEITGARFGIRSGRPGALLVLQDVTKRVAAEQSLRFLAKATEVLSSSLDYETTLRRVAELATERIAASCSVEPAGEGRALDAVDAHIVADGLHMVVPMKHGGRVLGVINFANSGGGRTFAEEDLELARELARRAAIAIDNARVHAELRHTARTLQESLLPPHLPAIDGVELAARFRPAGSGVEVGGDFYDIFETSEGQWAFVIGDVCGKGADAAALTALTRYTVRAAAMYEDGPDGVLAVLNEALLRQRRDFRFTTLAYCVIDLRTRPFRLRVATGGHPAPIVVRADGRAIAVSSGSPLLGVIPGAHFDAAEVDLGPGDAVVLYTDGLAEARAPARLLEEADLLAELERAHGVSPPELAERLEALALDGAERARDDIAILVLRLER